MLIALAANLANLLDRAPGRVIKYSLLAYAPLAIVAGAGPVGVAAAPVMGAALGMLPEDLRERVMLGDTGANVLGGVLGLVVVLECSAHGPQRDLRRADRGEPGVGVRVVQSGDRAGAAAAVVRPARPERLGTVILTQHDGAPSRVRRARSR